MAMDPDPYRSVINFPPGSGFRMGSYECGITLLAFKTGKFNLSDCVVWRFSSRLSSGNRSPPSSLSSIEEETDRRKRSSQYCLGDILECRISMDDLKKKLWKKIHFGRLVVWCGVIQMIIHLSEASILPSVCYIIHPFLQIILVLNIGCGMELNEFRPPNSRDDLCLHFCLFLLLFCPGARNINCHHFWIFLTVFSGYNLPVYSSHVKI